MEIYMNCINFACDIYFTSLILLYFILLYQGKVKRLEVCSFQLNSFFLSVKLSFFLYWGEKRGKR